MRPFVFLDKDGTLVEDVPYSVDPARIELAPGAIEALAALGAAGFGLAVVSNQSGIARGLFTQTDLDRYRVALETKLAEQGVALDGFFCCPHHPDGVGDYAISCECRKPAPGLLLRGARELGADLTASWMVGDILDDVEAGHRAGCRAVLVDRGHETEWLPGIDRTPDATVADLRAAADVILRAPDPATREPVAASPAGGER